MATNTAADFRASAEAIRDVGTAMNEFTGAAIAAAKTIREFGIAYDIAQWVWYEEAGAPYGYRRKDFDRWKMEQPWYWA